ncbi:glycosyl transferase [Microbacterium indicum]|uniref:glycosyl transferase n=1 Tax=Microbacterium indicum TaxID=358100 RepID=UPI00041EFA0B|nr:glycosyl transferase [Microbacterium indicum]
MRFVWAVVSFLAAVVLIGAGVAQLTVLKGPETLTSEIAPADASLPYTVIDADVFSENPGQQQFSASGADGEIVAAVGRTSDIEAWLSDVSYNHATAGGSEDGQPSVDVEVVDPTGDFEGDRATNDPRGSDLWVSEDTGDGSLEQNFSLPDGMSVLLATDGSAAAPADLSLTWDVDVTTPWAGPLIALGALALLVGLVFWIAGFIGLRRRRGPRRKGPKLPPTAPISKKEIAAAEGDAEPTAKRIAVPARRRALAGIPALLATGALLAGCSPSAWPDFSSTPSPTPTPTSDAQADQETPAITDAQAARIVASMADTIAQADQDNDADLASQRMDGAALALRTATYGIRADVTDYAAPTTFPDGPVSVLLPQANDGWPRTALVVVGDSDGDQSPTILTMQQADPWAEYKATYVANIGANVELPELAPAWLGAALVTPDSSFLQIAPQDLAAAYADIIANGEDSSYAPLFDLDDDTFRTALQDKRDTTLANFNETGEGTAEMTFDQGPGDSDPVSLATFDSGAIVAVSLTDSETARPTNEDAFILIPDAPQIQHFVDETETATGLTTSYESELFFYVPAKSSDEPIRILGYQYALTGSELLPEAEGE